ncbi:Vacuolar ATP synthase 16 kDa proteolipid subunit [Giardia muris]|uniref:V-type proton ATPase proteolipid subunit n=1 Tax=Giardia muris TaxID=5742 RepID=A0A4Z1STZ0_GIAMU|nr:Vacuolar ATP synthase 16 kDa proteolipid subunit [Giardia muris]|eukprot:TNJ29382.1 Vacuolar ATP synthase 16 kDa proteolipid subunit [Giardia muris]
MSTTNANLDLACPYTSCFYGYFGSACGIAFSCLGSAYGTAKAGKGVMAAGVMKPNAAMKNTLPVIMAGILGIYGLINAIVANTVIKSSGDGILAGRVPLMTSFAALAAGLCTGLSALAAGIAIGVTGNAGVRAVARKPKLFVVMLLTLVFGEALALYGLIIALILLFSGGGDICKAAQNGGVTN